MIRQNSWKDLKTPDEEVKDSDSQPLGCPYSGIKVNSQEKGADSDNDPNEKLLKRNSQSKLNEDERAAKDNNSKDKPMESSSRSNKFRGCPLFGRIQPNEVPSALERLKQLKSQSNASHDDDQEQ